MARFVFTLQTVLEQREREEQLAQKNHAQARLAQRTLEEQLAVIEAELQSANDLMRDDHLVGKIDVQTLATHRRYLIAMRTSVISVAQKIAAARIQVEATLRKLSTAAKNHKAIAVLRDRQLQRWQAEQNKRELAIADDAAMQIAYHNLSEHLVESFGGSAA